MRNAKRKILERTEFLLWLSPAHYDLREMLNDYKTTDLKEYPSAVLTPNHCVNSWICHKCTHLNKHYHTKCEICDGNGKNDDTTNNNNNNNFNCRYTWTAKIFQMMYLNHSKVHIINKTKCS